MKLHHNSTYKRHYCPIISLLRFVILTSVFLSVCSPLTAQVNIFTAETMKKLQTDPGLYNRINLDITYQTGNTDILTLRTRFRSDYITETLHAFIFGSLQQGRKDGEFYTNKGMSHGRFIRNLTNDFMVETFAQKQFNESISLNDRNLVGVGLRYAIPSPKSQFVVYMGTGVMFEHELIDDITAGEITTRLVRSTNYINWSAQLENRISTSATAYYQMHVGNPNDYRILFEGSILFNITTKFGIPLSVNFGYDNEPPAGIRKLDLEIFNGLSYTF